MKGSSGVLVGVTLTLKLYQATARKYEKWGVGRDLKAVRIFSWFYSRGTGVGTRRSMLLQALRTQAARLILSCGTLRSHCATLDHLVSRGRRSVTTLRSRVGHLRARCTGLGATGVLSVDSKRVGSAGSELSGLIHRMSGYVTLLGTWSVVGRDRSLAVALELKRRPVSVAVQERSRRTCHTTRGLVGRECGDCTSRCPSLKGRACLYVTTLDVTLS